MRRPYNATGEGRLTTGEKVEDVAQGGRAALVDLGVAALLARHGGELLVLHVKHLGEIAAGGAKLVRLKFGVLALGAHVGKSGGGHVFSPLRQVQPAYPAGIYSFYALANLISPVCPLTVNSYWQSTSLPIMATQGMRCSLRGKPGIGDRIVNPNAGMCKLPRNRGYVP